MGSPEVAAASTAPTEAPQAVGETPAEVVPVAPEAPPTTQAEPSSPPGAPEPPIDPLTAETSTSLPLSDPNTPIAETPSPALETTDINNNLNGEPQ